MCSLQCLSSSLSPLLSSFPNITLVYSLVLHNIAALLLATVSHVIVDVSVQCDYTVTYSPASLPSAPVEEECAGRRAGVAVR
jgi:hypothetical protein